MLNTFPIALVAGLITGFLAGIGVGGGSLLILWLTLVLHMDQSTARSINLLFFLFAAGTVSLFRWKQGTLNLKKLFPAILSGCVSAALFAYFSHQVDVDMMKKLFGILLLVTGIRELFYRPAKFR